MCGYIRMGKSQQETHKTGVQTTNNADLINNTSLDLDTGANPNPNPNPDPNRNRNPNANPNPNPKDFTEAEVVSSTRYAIPQADNGRLDSTLSFSGSCG